jgi:HlyD family secretion protein
MRKKIMRIVYLLIFGVLIIGSIVFLYKKSQPKVIAYKSVAPSYIDIAEKTVATGKVVPRKEIEIKPQGVSGIIEKIYLEAGTIIKKGDKIAKIKIIPDMINLNSAESRLKRSKISFNNSKIDFDRDSKLFDDKVISDSEFRKSKVLYKEALNELNSSEDNLQLIKEGITKKSAGTSNTIIRSTIDGMILNIPVKEGYSVIQSNTFNAGTTIAVVADMKDMIFEGKIDEIEVSKLKKGMDFVLTIGALPNDKFNANLEYVSPKGELDNGSIKFEIKASLSLQDNKFIRSGYSANAEIILVNKEKVMSVKEKYVSFKNDSAFVQIQISPQVFENKYIETGISDGINIEIISGLNKDDLIKGDIKTADANL